MAWVKQKRKTVCARLVSGVSQHITDLVCDSVLLIYSDGSSKRTHVHMAPQVGRIGVFVPATEHCRWVRLLAPVHEDERQTNNVVEPTAAITGLRLC